MAKMYNIVEGKSSIHSNFALPDWKVRQKWRGIVLIFCNTSSGYQNFVYVVTLSYSSSYAYGFNSGEIQMNLSPSIPKN